MARVDSRNILVTPHTAAVRLVDERAPTDSVHIVER